MFSKFPITPEPKNGRLTRSLGGPKIFPNNVLRMPGKRFVTAMVLFGLSVMLWAPWGINIGSGNDDALLVRGLNIDLQPFNGDHYSKLIQGNILKHYLLASRPWVTPALFIARDLSPEGWSAPNLISLFSIFFKGLFLAWICWLLWPRCELFAFVAGAFAIVYPVDRSLFSIDCFAHHLSIALYLLSTALLLVYWQTARLQFIGGVIATQIVYLGLFETVYPLVFCTPLLLLVDRNRIRHTKRFRAFAKVSAIWLTLPVIRFSSFVYSLFFLIKVNNWSGEAELTYQQQILDRSTDFGKLLHSGFHVIQWHFAKGFHRSGTALVNMIASPTPMVTAAMFGGLLTAIACWFLIRDRAVLSKNWNTQGISAATVGLTATFLGYIVFCVTGYRYTIDRSFLFSQPGAALVMATVPMYLSRAPLPVLWGLAGIFLLFLHWSVTATWIVVVLIIASVCRSVGSRKITFVVITCLLVVCFLSERLTTHAEYINRSREFFAIPMNIVRQARNFTPGSEVVLIEKTNAAGQGGIPADFSWNVLANYYNERFLRLMYKTPELHFRVCYDRGDEVLGCRFYIDGLSTIENFQGEWVRRPWNEIVAFCHDEDGVRLIHQPDDSCLLGPTPGYSPDNRINPAGPLPIRYHTMFDHLINR